jgi:hypothetical protein
VKVRLCVTSGTLSPLVTHAAGVTKVAEGMMIVHGREKIRPGGCLKYLNWCTPHIKMLVCHTCFNAQGYVEDFRVSDCDTRELRGRG